ATPRADTMLRPRIIIKLNPVHEEGARLSARPVDGGWRAEAPLSGRNSCCVAPTGGGGIALPPGIRPLFGTGAAFWNSPSLSGKPRSGGVFVTGCDTQLRKESTA